MTAVCVSSGPSQPRPGVAALVAAASGGSSFAVFTGNFAPLAILFPILGVVSYSTPAFCAVDPPAMPGAFTVQELLDLTTSTYSADYTTGFAKLQAIAANVAWWALCECVTGATPAPDPAPTPPTGAPVFVGPGYGTNATPCATYSGKFTAVPVTGGYGAPDLIGISYGNAGPFTQVNLPAGADTLILTATNAVNGARPDSFRYEVNFFIDNHQPSGAMPTSLQFVSTALVASGTSQAFTIPIPSAANGFAVLTTFYGHPDTTNISSVVADIYCNAAPGQQINACCPPDANSVQLLNQIMSAVTLIQRQIAPFAYVTGTAHPGLSGDGQLSVQGILGLAVAATALPTRAGEVAGDPVQLYDIGWINVGTADGFGPRQFISSNPFILRPVAGDVTVVGYSIPSDVTVTITELIREP